jgi:rhodanese-related sulfurtransferase
MGRILAHLLPDKDAPVVFFCTGWDCWLSRNAALRAVELGYRSVYWYRGGFASWRAAGLPVVQPMLHASLE